MMPTARGLNGSSATRRIAAAALAVCGLMLLGAAPGWAKGSIAWHGCGPKQPANLQCGELSVPLDYHHRHGAKITLGFNRLPAADPAHRVGSLIVNPGGPGGPGSFFVAVEAAGGHLWNPALHKRFDMIGMDPRGVGTSTPVQCDPRVYNRLISQLFPSTEAHFDQLASSARAFGQSCLKRTGPLLAHVDTRSAARDMEALRRALGDGKLNYLGLSYGAHLGSAYAELYPKRIRTMALDAIANHSVSVKTVFADAAATYEDTLNRFAAWCAQTISCPLHGRDVLALFDSVVQRADQQPIPAPKCADGSCRPAVSGGEIRMQALLMLVTKDGIPAVGFSSWKDFAIALARADQGDASDLSPELATSPLEFSGQAINCADYPREIVTYKDFVAKTLLGRGVAPHTQGASEAWLGILACMRWPVPVTYRPHSIMVRGAPRILLVGSTHDPETNYVWAHELLNQMPSAVLLTRDGDGHTSSWLQHSRTSDAIAHYLITRHTPPPNTVYPD
jgi:pimeloyl-ACP methyl ester carboxylesterase